MKIDQKPRDFSYILHKENLPIEIKGTMKRRQGRPNSTHPLTQQSNTVMLVKDQLVHKVIQNYQDIKCVVPVDLNYEKIKKQSLKVYEQKIDGDGTGAAYLMTKSKVEPKHPQKRHLTDRALNQQKTNEILNKQKRHYQQKYSQSTTEFDAIPSKKHSQTLHQKLSKDLYSQIDMKQNNAGTTVKMSEKTMFKQGCALGYEKNKEPTISSAKKKEITGSILDEEGGKKRNYRGDWRKSSFILG